jgi:hypothetical protein
MISSGRMSLLWNKLADGAKHRKGLFEPGDHFVVQKLLLCGSNELIARGGEFGEQKDASTFQTILL